MSEPCAVERSLAPTTMDWQGPSVADGTQTAAQPVPAAGRRAFEAWRGDRRGLLFPFLSRLGPVPPLLPVMANTDDGTYDTANEELFSPIEKARLPMEYLAKLFSAGNIDPVRIALKKQYAVRLFKRLETVGDMDPAGGRSARVGPVMV